MKRNGFIAVIMIIGVLGCASAQQGWYEAVRIDTVEAYEAFIAKHPDGEYAEMARENLKLRTAEIQKVERLREKYTGAAATQMSLFHQYEIGTLTEEEFIADGWDAVAPFFGGLGIIGAQKMNEKLTLVIGNYSRESMPWSIDVTTTSSSGFQFRVFQTYHRNLSPKELDEVSHDYQYFFEKYRSTGLAWEQKVGHRVGELVFIDGILKSKSLSVQK